MTRHAMILLAVILLPRPALAQQAAAAPRSQPPAASRFEHGRHRSVPCASCHSSTRRHGEVMIRTREDCMRCHHAGAERQQCTACHQVAAMRRLPMRPRSFALTASHTAVTISIRFDHRPHTDLDCSLCHSAKITHEPDQANCATCHALHHGPEATCTTCHAGAGVKAKHTRDAHLNCSTAACHGSAAADLPDTREACLVCHTEQRSHMGDRVCTTCHPMRGTR